MKFVKIFAYSLTSLLFVAAFTLMNSKISLADGWNSDADVPEYSELALGSEWTDPRLKKNSVKNSGTEVHFSLGPVAYFNQGYTLYGHNLTISAGYRWQHVGLSFDLDLASLWSSEGREADNNDYVFPVWIIQTIPIPTVSLKGYFPITDRFEIIAQLGVGTVIVIPFFLKVGAAFAYRVNEVFSVGGSVDYTFVVGHSYCDNDGTCRPPYLHGLTPNVFFRIQF